MVPTSQSQVPEHAHDVPQGDSPTSPTNLTGPASHSSTGEAGQTIDTTSETSETNKTSGTIIPGDTSEFVETEVTKEIKQVNTGISSEMMPMLPQNIQDIHQQTKSDISQHQSIQTKFEQDLKIGRIHSDIISITQPPASTVHYDVPNNSDDILSNILSLSTDSHSKQEHECIPHDSTTISPILSHLLNSNEVALTGFHIASHVHEDNKFTNNSIEHNEGDATATIEMIIPSQATELTKPTALDELDEPSIPVPTEATEPAESDEAVESAEFAAYTEPVEFVHPVGLARPIGPIEQLEPARSDPLAVELELIRPELNGSYEPVAPEEAELLGQKVEVENTNQSGAKPVDPTQVVDGQHHKHQSVMGLFRLSMRFNSNDNSHEATDEGRTHNYL